MTMTMNNKCRLIIKKLFLDAKGIQTTPKTNCVSQECKLLWISYYSCLVTPNDQFRVPGLMRDAGADT